MKRHVDNPKSSTPERSDDKVFASQSWKWLTERLAYPPQVRLVFGEESPQSVGTRKNFEEL
jgi:hypothetical protein